ncbi:T6SS effector amidase Tae4 family protein [Campylobacter troglodytis]|uniref:T6SS effector amidase Tae4 family protein n=1 Tax=Campylobacter troglodytis TaxID=654363 RepID=UPI001FE7A068|nr:T6SS effector amidase Tae4 family protein [Campylobacter troglodytis]
MDKYYNTCALRISYALNHSTHPINTMDKQIAKRTYQGEDKDIYIWGCLILLKF